MIAPVRARDYDVEMVVTIRNAIPEWDFVPSVVAAQLVERLWREDPDLLSGWLEAQATAILTRRIDDLTRVDRNRGRRNAKAGAFAQAAQDAEAAGDSKAMGAFSVVYEVDIEHTRRYVRDMTGRDHTFVADRYTESSERAKMLSSFHRAVAKQVGDRKTSDVLSPQQYEALYRSITGGQS